MYKTILLLIFFPTGILNLYAQGMAEVSIPFNVYDNAGGEKVLYFGIDTTATDTIDFHLGESNLPPVPPAGAFDARWILPKNDFSGTLSSWFDFRNTPGFPFTDTLEHRLKYQAKSDADTMIFSWNFPPEVTGLLQDLITGTLVNQPLSDSGIFAMTNFAVLNQLKLIIYYDAVLPVELSSFSATVFGSSVQLNWTTSSEINNMGFEIERLEWNRQLTIGNENTGWEKIGYVQGNGTTAEAKSYSFVDNTVTTGMYSYRLKQIDFDGSYAYSNEIEVGVDFTPKEFVLHQNYPNPFNPSTTVEFSVPTTGTVTIKIFDMLGREIRALYSAPLAPGSYKVQWDGLNDAGIQMSSGTYLYRMTAGEFIQSKKMILIK